MTIRLGRDPRDTLVLIREVSLSGQAQLGPRALMERVCVDLAEAFGLDRVAATRYHSELGEVSEVAVAGALPPTRRGRRPITSAPLLVEARERQELVCVSRGDVPFTFALPLISDARCLGFLSGSRRGTAPADEEELDALATVGVIAATLLDGAVVREELQHLHTLKSEFIALAAHELRTPLSSIYGICMTVAERGETLPEPDRLALQSALREQTARMRLLIEQLLDLSRFDLAGVDVSPERLRLRPRVEDLVRGLRDPRFEAVRVSVPTDLHAVVDPVALDRMLSNLVTNALKYGAPPVTVSAARRDTHLRLAVEDRGKGVDREFVPRLFDRFTRSPAAQSRGDGSGLGLAIAQAYARAHGGDIVYERADPHGARFEVVIPLNESGRDQAPPAGGLADAPRLNAQLRGSTKNATET